MRMVAIIHVLAKVVTFTATFIFVHSKDDQLAAAIILSAPSLLAAIFCGFAIRLAAPVRFHPPGWTDVRGAFASSWHLFLSNAAATLYLNTNAFVLGLLSGNYAVALYTLANKIALSVFNLLGPVVQAVFPRASLLLHQPDNAEAKAFLRRLIRWLLPIAALLSVMLVILAPLIVQLLGGASFRDAVPVVRVMGVLPLVLTCATLLAQIIMVNVGLSRSLSRIYLVAGLVNLGMLPLLIRRFDAGGAALSLVLVEILGPILMVRAIRRAGTFTGRILPS
jgi:PST family polysaccharide transporter